MKTFARAYAVLSVFLLTSCTTPSPNNSRLASSSGASQTSQQTLMDAVVKIESVYQGVGTGTVAAGFFVNRQGYFLTSYHVVENAINATMTLRVSTHDGQSSENVEVIACQNKSSRDLCLLRVSLKNKQFLKIAKSLPAVGTEVSVIGHPQNFAYSLAKGHIAAVRRPASTGSITQIQFTAPISPGSSGGPVLNSKQQVVGLATAVWREAGSQNLNFAVAQNELLEFAKANLKNATVSLAHFATKEIESKKLAWNSAFLAPMHSSLESLRMGKNPESQHFERVQAKVGALQIKSWLSRTLSNYCHVDQEQTWDRMRCSKDQHFLELQLKKGSLEQFKYALNVGETPISLIEDLQEKGHWSEVSKKLSTEQVVQFYSRVVEQKCFRAENEDQDKKRNKRIPANSVRPNYILTDDANLADYCVQKIANFPDLGGVTISIVGYSQSQGVIKVVNAGSLFRYQEDWLIQLAQAFFQTTEIHSL